MKNVQVHVQNMTLLFRFSDSFLPCRETCQGHEFGTASTPSTILFLEKTTGWIAAIPQFSSENTHLQY